MTVNCAQIVHAVYMLNAVNFTECCDLGLEFIIFSSMFFFKIHWHELTVYTNMLITCSPLVNALLVLSLRSEAFK